MASYRDRLALADRYLEVGSFADAKLLYEELLEEKPDCAELWHRAGNSARQTGQLDLAIERLRQAVILKPDYAEAISDLGTVLQIQGKLDEAVASYRAAIKVRPKLAALHFNLGNALKLQGNNDEAIASYCRSVEIDPNFAEGYFNLGVTCHELGLLQEATRHYREAILLHPEFSAAHSSLGNALQEQGMHADAVACYQRALAIAPHDPVTYNNMGNAFRAKEQYQEALACYGRALEFNQSYAEAYSNLGTIFQKLGNLPEAFTCYQTALQINPSFGQAYTNLGTALQEQGQLNEAHAYQCRAIELNPNDIEAHVNRAMLLLLAGEFEQGWQEYEWRLRLPGMNLAFSKQPHWTGEPLTGRVVLVHAEQGLGDTFQFVRYLAVLQALGARILFSSPKSLHPILQSCRGIDRLLMPGQKPPSHDFQIALLSLPGILKTTLESIPSSIPYLFADPSLVTKWGEKLGPKPRLRIGINWRGRTGLGAFRSRDIPLDQFGRLARIPGVQVVSLQKDSHDESKVAQLGIWDPGQELDRDHGAFMDSAAIISNLDLVITSDTSVAHLAGAMGAQTWLILPAVPDWRWLLDRSDSPWYPTLQVLRQLQLGNWDPVFDEIVSKLDTLLQI